MRIAGILEQGSAAINEDVLLMEEDVFGVFDGATSLVGTVFEGGRTGGYLAARLASLAFREGGAPLTLLAERANAAIRAQMLRQGVDLARKAALWSASAAVVRVGDGGLEWVQTGDCVILLILEDGSHELLCAPLDHDRETLCLWREACKTTDAGIREALGAQIRKVRERMNIDYGVLNGEPEAMGFLRSGLRPLSGVAHAVLMTDGLFLPKCDPGEREDFSAFVEKFLETGLCGVRAYVRETERTDPRCAVYPRFKTHDDIAAVSLSFQRGGSECAAQPSKTGGIE